MSSSPSQDRINDLPEEILIAILSRTVESWDPTGDIRLLELTCQRWYSLVEATPDFWTNVTSREGMNYVDRALVKSKNAPIDILFGSSHDLSQFFARIDPHILRWRSLKLYLERPPSNLGALERTPAPQLEVLHLYIPMGHKTGRKWNIFGGGECFNQLCDVVIKSFPVEFDQLRLRNLTSLRLHALTDISLPKLMSILKESPFLESLVIMELYNVTPGDKTWPQFQLRFLTRVSIAKVDPSATSMLLSRIRAPACKTFIITCSLDNSSPLGLLLAQDLSHWHPVVREIVSQEQVFK
ncbi:hypothetical protein FRB90_007237, partial [Tulasnella sp. 427]